MNKARSRHFSIRLQRRGLAACALVGLQSCVAVFPTVQPPFAPITASASTFSPKLFENVAIYVDDQTRQLPNRDGALRSVEDAFISAALSRGYTVATRSDAAKIAAEANLQSNHILEGTIAAKARLHGVSAILVVTVDRVAINLYRPARQIAGGWVQASPTTTSYKAEVAISARLIDAELGEILWISRLQGDSLVAGYSEVSSILPRFAATLASDLPSVRQSTTADLRMEGEQLPRVAPWAGVSRLGFYVDDETHGLSNTDGVLRSIEGEFIAAAIAHGFVVIARTDIPELASELRLQAGSPLMDSVVMARVGRIMRVEAMVVVSVNQLAIENYQEYASAPNQVKIQATLGARVVNVNGRMLWIRDQTGTMYGFDRSDSERYLVALAQELAAAIPGLQAVPAIEPKAPGGVSTTAGPGATRSCAPLPLLVGRAEAARLANWQDSLRWQLSPLASSSSNGRSILHPLTIRTEGIVASPLKDAVFATNQVENGKVKPLTGIAGIVGRRHLNRKLSPGERVYVTAISVDDSDVRVALVTQSTMPIPGEGTTVESQFKAVVQWNFPAGQLRAMPRSEVFAALTNTLSIEGC